MVWQPCELLYTCYLLTLTHPASQPPTHTARRYVSTGTATAWCLCLSVCLSVCLSQVGVLSKQPDGSSCVLAWKLLSTYPTLCYKDIPVSGKIKVGYFPLLCNFVLNVRLQKKFRHNISIVETCYQLSSTKVDARGVTNRYH